MQYQASKHTKKDPFDVILDHNQGNPHTYMDKDISNEMDHNKNIHSKHKVRNNLQGSGEKQTEEVCSNTRVVNEYINEWENIVKTRYGRIVRKPDRLMYQQ